MDTRNLEPGLEEPETENGILTLCGVQGCCPTVDFNDPEDIVIRDDHGGEVRLTRAEWGELAKYAAKSAT
jgi:hypothetical protein